MTPLIDVVFLLLIFFVCASTGQISESLLPTELAGGAVAATDVTPVQRPLGEAWVRVRPTEDNGGVEIEVEGRVFSGNSRHQDLAIFLKTLSSAAAELPVILDIAPEITLGEALAAYDAALAAEFDAIHFAIAPQSVDPRPVPDRP